MKHVILVVIDALATRVFEPAVAEGRLPHLASLVDRGVHRSECISAFPSITPAATASIMTGRYPNGHAISGAFWFDRERHSVAYYGSDFWIMVEEGLGKYVDDYLLKLNYQRLKSETLSEMIERNEGTSAILNYMWFRGDTDHDVNGPLALRLLPGVNFAPRIRGPKIIGLADFAVSEIPGTGKTFSPAGGITRRFGFHDDTTGAYLLELAEMEKLPDFTLAYFPNNDFESHACGPENSAKQLEIVDAHLGKFFEARGGIDRVLEECTIIVTGDHAQSDLECEMDCRAINLDKCLEPYQVAALGGEWADNDDMMVCPNMRSAQIYLRSPSIALRDRTVAALLSEDRVDQVLIRLTDEECAGQGAGNNGLRYRVLTSDRGQLTFGLASADDSPGGTDAWGNRWTWHGSLDCIDADVSDSGQIRYGAYPNALERIVTGFTSVAGEIWVTARRGGEFCGSGHKVNECGSHGSLLDDDSLSPLIVAGAPEGISIPKAPRIVDVAPLCLDVLNLSEAAGVMRQAQQEDIEAPAFAVARN